MIFMTGNWEELKELSDEEMKKIIKADYRRVLKGSWTNEEEDMLEEMGRQTVESLRGRY